MRKIIIFLILLCLLVSGVSAAITDCTVENTNIYAGSNLLQIGPSGQIDSTSTATGITNVAGRYIYATGLTADVTGATAAYTLEGRQGSTTIESDTGTAQGMVWNYGDGTTAQTGDTTYTYAEPGTYQTSLKLTNYLDSTGVTVNTGDYNILPIAPVASISATTAQLGDTVSLGAAGILWSGIQWQYTTDGTTWQDISGATTATYQWTPEAGVYTIRAKVTSTATGYTAYSNTVSLGVYAPPVISSTTASPEIATTTPQTVTLSATVTDSGPDATTYQWQQQPIGTTTWADISGATTAQWTGQLTISQATQYRLQATGTGGTTTSQTVWIYPQTTATATPQTGTPQTQITLSAANTYGADIQWQYTTGTTWQDISGATTATYQWTPGTAAEYTVRVEVTYPAKTLYSTTTAFTIYAPPTITGLSISPEMGQYTQTITLAAEVTDTGIDETAYQWQQSPEGQNTWTDIAGATTATWIGTLTFTGATDFRLLATGTGGTTTSSTITYYIAAPGEIQSLSASPNVVSLPGSTTLTATGSNVRQWEWQEYTSGAWVTIGYGATLAESLTDAGTYTYRVVATGADGATITSESLEVLAGFAPTVEITSPADNAELQAGSTVTASATITGTDVTFRWNLGTDAEGSTETNPSTVTYSTQGYKTITIYAESIFGSASDTVTILYGKAPRPMQTELFDDVDTSLVDNFVNQFDVQPGEMPNPVGIMESLFQPFDDALKGFFWVLVFGAIMLVVWLITKSVALPSVLGVLFGAFMVGFMPDMYLMPAVALIAAGMAGGVLYVIKRQ